MAGRVVGRLDRTDLVALCAAGGLCALLALTRTQLGDYDVRAVGADNPAPAIDALLHGDLSRYAHVQPLIGLTSLLVRLPFAALAGHDALWTYRLGSLACLLGAAVLALVVDRRLRARDEGIALRAVVGLALIANPFTLDALNSGHPEEVLGGALAAGAVLASLDRRTVWAGLFAGLAIGTKQWGLVVLGPMALALPRGSWPRALAVTVVTAAAMVLPGVLASPARYRAAGRDIASYHRVYPQSAWWPASQRQTLTVNLGGGETTRIEPHRLPFGLDRGVTSGLTLAAVAAATILLLAIGAPAGAALALLGAALALRAFLDPADLAYYLAPCAIAALTWGGWQSGRVIPVLGAGTLAWLGFTTRIHLAGGLRFALVALAMAALATILSAPFWSSRSLATLASPEKGGGPYR